ncbi:hypothetical protein ACOMHN_049324 [Nucella lapillus]
MSDVLVKSENEKFKVVIFWKLGHDRHALGEEGMWLEFRDMASYLILYSSHHLCEDLLHMASYLILYSSHHLCEDLLHMASYLILYSSHHLCEDLHMASYLILYSSHHLCEDLLHMASYLILYSSHHLCEDLLHMASYLILYSVQQSPPVRILEQELSCVLLTNFIEEQWVAVEQYFKVAL